MKILFIFGTRPEAIKLAPVIKEMRKFPRKIDLRVCVTSQHLEMLRQVMRFFKIEPDFDLKIMERGQSLFDITAKAFARLEKVLRAFKPDLVIVQGDTTSAFVGALSGFYVKARVAHVEAGLRSGDKYSPFPEEINRKLTSGIADLHFAPTAGARKNLLKEGVLKNIFVTGNTVVDALRESALRIEKDARLRSALDRGLVRMIGNAWQDKTARFILVTAHRRENFGGALENICAALKVLARNNPGVHIVYPVHPNPNISLPVSRLLGDIKNIHLVKPMDYPHLVRLMSRCSFILTDSGGIQEEAPSLGKPVLVMRGNTERPEAVAAGTAKLVGTGAAGIVASAQRLLDSRRALQSMANRKNPFGDGKAAARIVKIILGASMPPARRPRP